MKHLLLTTIAAMLWWGVRPKRSSCLLQQNRNQMTPGSRSSRLLHQKRNQTNETPPNHNNRSRASGGVWNSDGALIQAAKDGDIEAVKQRGAAVGSSS